MLVALSKSPIKACARPPVGRVAARRGRALASKDTRKSYRCPRMEAAMLLCRKNREVGATALDRAARLDLRCAVVCTRRQRPPRPGRWHLESTMRFGRQRCKLIVLCAPQFNLMMPMRTRTCTKLLEACRGDFEPTWRADGTADRRDHQAPSTATPSSPLPIY